MRWMEKKQEDKSGGEHVNFVYNIEIEDKASSFLSIQPSQLYLLISHLKLKLTDIYVDSKVIKDSSMKDYFNNY